MKVRPAMAPGERGEVRARQLEACEAKPLSKAADVRPQNGGQRAQGAGRSGMEDCPDPRQQSPYAQRRQIPGIAHGRLRPGVCDQLLRRLARRNEVALDAHARQTLALAPEEDMGLSREFGNEI